MNTAASVSVIVPVYNASRFLPSALESIGAQTVAVAEIIVVDDGSSDESAEVAAAFPNTILLQQENKGAAAARNYGLTKAAGEFIAFLDADDLWLPEKTEKQLEMFARTPELELCLSRLQNFIEQDVERPWWVPERSLAEPWDSEQLGTILVRREVFPRIGNFDESLRLGEDVDWFRRCKNEGIICATFEEVTVRRRIHASNLSHQRSPEQSTRLALELLQRSIKAKRRKRD